MEFDQSRLEYVQLILPEDGMAVEQAPAADEASQEVFADDTLEETAQSADTDQQQPEVTADTPAELPENDEEPGLFAGLGTVAKLAVALTATSTLTGAMGIKKALIKQSKPKYGKSSGVRSGGRTARGAAIHRKTIIGYKNIKDKTGKVVAREPIYGK